MEREDENLGAWRFWVDRGGTFTDIVACDPSGRIRKSKVLSERAGSDRAATLIGIRSFLGLAESDPIPADLVKRLKIGTTVATNALLERKGSPLVFITNAGLGDLLLIGQQNRPDIFAREIRKAKALHAEVIEIKGRVAADGQEIEPLDLDAAERSLRQAHVRGLRVCAIALMHSYRFPEHEKRLGALARAIGYTHVSLSSEADPLPKIVLRGYTTVVDAYLSEVLERFIQGLQNQVPDIPLYFMQSHGGLADASYVKAKDSLLSGPAGGLIGARKISEESGFSRFISFDMGGTSTDVALFDGQEFERSDEMEIAGLRVRTPLFAIHTIAAGGGSVCRIVDQRFQVGPASAGANPGPASYRQGGPLTITDCNLFLGRLQSSFFPSVFGPERKDPLDYKAVVLRLQETAQAMREQGEAPMSVEEIALGFLELSAEQMAQAIRHISVQRGQKPDDYVLCCFGGAGGQHACRVAEKLGMTRILIHPLAGVLSAYGIGCAPIRWMQARTIEKTFAPSLLKELDRHWSELEAEGRKALIDQEAKAESIAMKRRLKMRYQGSDTHFLIDAASYASVRKSFSETHERQFGFDWGDRALIVSSIELSASGFEDRATAFYSEPVEAEARLARAEPVRFYDRDGWQSVPVYRPAEMPFGEGIPGPFLLVDPLATLVVEKNWILRKEPAGQLVMEFVGAKEDSAGDLNPVLLEIFHRRFQSIAEQMGSVLALTAQSVNIKERLDFSCAIFDADGQLVANAPHVPVHLGSMDASVQSIKRQFRGTLKPGSVFALNDPYRGGTHLPDITVVTPVFDRSGETLLFWVAARGHHADVGGLTPGSMPPESRSIEEEGIWLSGFPLVVDGEFQEDALRKQLGQPPFPARNPDQNIADIQAQIAANHCGLRELKRLVDDYGLDLVWQAMQAIQDNAARSVQRLIRTWKPGRFRCEADAGWAIEVDIQVDAREGRATFDFTGTSPQRRDNFNTPPAIVRAVVLYVLRVLLDEAIPLNGGCLRPIELILPEGSMLAPRFPAAVVAGNVETSQVIADTIFAALNAMAASQGTMNNLTFGNERYQYYETIAGGSGAGPDFPGASGVQTHMTNSRITDPEILEARFPVRLETFALRRGSGGRGLFSGGDGVIRKIRFLEAMDVGILSNRRTTSPFGLAGAFAGRSGAQWIEHGDGSREPLASSDRKEVNAGDAIIIETPGGGGFGVP